MNPDLVLEIVNLALSLTQDQSPGTVQEDAALAATLLQIVQKGALAYSQQTGQPLDPSLIQPEAPLT